MNLDLKIFYFLNNMAGKSDIIDNLIIFFAEYLPYLLILFFLLLLIFSVYTKREKNHIFFTVIISALVARFGVAEIIRLFYKNPRPFLNHNVHQLILVNGYSFPSGHSAFFFAMATAIYFFNKKWGIGFFAASIIINLSRVIVGVHYPSDIFGGMVIGIMMAYLVFYFMNRKLRRT